MTNKSELILSIYFLVVGVLCIYSVYLISKSFDNDMDTVLERYYSALFIFIISVSLTVAGVKYKEAREQFCSEPEVLPKIESPINYSEVA